jgi:eukaryotic-like serine/threonine-protein kinase
MPSPANNDELLDLVRKSGVLDEKRLEGYLAKVGYPNGVPPEPSKFAGVMVRDGVLTHFQAEQLNQGKWRRFTIGRYKVLERLGAGGMGSVYLCEHKLMRRRVAVKVLPTAKAEEPASLERFYREARAVAALDHPNIVRAYDIDQDDKLHFLVMEFVDGANFQEIIKRSGPMDVTRAAHYIRQAALGIQHAHEAAGLVHRDIKPGNILVDRNGIVKVLDMGLARFFHDTDDILTKKYDENVLGTADYLAPEQALDSHGVDIRADIYSLGATFYFCLTGRPPFAEGSIAQKLIWHQTRQPKPVRSIRPDVPAEIAAIIEKAMAKDPAQRYQTPIAVAEALAPWTTTPIPLPPESEMPHLSLAAMGGGAPGGGAPGGGATLTGLSQTGSSDPPSGTRKPWQVANGSSPSAAPPRLPTPAPPTVPSSPDVNLHPNSAAPAASPTPPVLRPATTVQPGSKAPVRPVLSPVPLRPTPAPTRQAAAPVQAPAAPLEEEAASWEQMVSDTEDLMAQLDTTPKSGKRSGASRKGPSGRNLQALTASTRRLWIVVGVATAAVLMLVALITWIAIAVSSWPKQQQGQTQRPPLLVDPTSEDKATFKTIQQAVNQAHAHDHIHLMTNISEGNVNIPQKENLVIESAPGQLVTWKFPAGLSDSDKMLAVVSVTGFELKHVTLDGAQKAKSLITLYGTCPGLKLTDLELRYFKDYGVSVIGCDGTASQPVDLFNLRFTTDKPTQTGLFFDYPGNAFIQKSQYITVRGCAFTGEGHKITATNRDAVKDVKLEGASSFELATPTK